MNFGIDILGGNISVSLDRAMENAGNIVLGTAKSLCPKGIEDKLNMQKNEMSVLIYADTPYAQNAEFGSPKMAPQPFLVPSLIGANDEILEAISDGLEIL